MALFPAIRAQLRSVWPVIGAILAISAGLISIVLYLRLVNGVPIGHLTRDLTAIASLPFYTGFLSQVSILLWAAAAAICLFSGYLLAKLEYNGKFRRFLWISGLFTLFLGLDDAFLLHEEALPSAGIPETIVYIGYGAVLLFYLVGFYSIILQTEYLLLGMAFCFLGVSLVADLLRIPVLGSYLVEDSAKLVGIVSWLAYFFRLGASIVVGRAALRLGPGGLVMDGTRTDQAPCTGLAYEVVRDPSQTTPDHSRR